MLVNRKVTPISKFSGTYLYTLKEKGTVRIKCSSETLRSAQRRARAWTVQSEVQGINSKPIDNRASRGDIDALLIGETNSTVCVRANATPITTFSFCIVLLLLPFESFFTVRDYGMPSFVNARNNSLT